MASKFPTAFNPPPVLAVPSGSEYEPKYEWRTLPDGQRQLEKVGEVNAYDVIQASLESTKIENIIRRYNAGDPTALSAVQGAYMDVVNLPTDLAGMQSLIDKVKSDFSALPEPLRKAYNFSAEQYVSDYGTDHWRSVLADIFPDKKPVESEVVKSGN